MAAMRINEFRAKVAEAQNGDKIYINSINFSPAAVRLLRVYIHDRVLIPDKDELKKMIVPEAIEKYMSGECICPQMTYIRARR